MNLIKVVSVLFFLLTGTVCQAQNVVMESVRNNYKKAVYEKNICQNMIELLNKNTDKNVHIAYLGAFQTIWAKHINNPVAKLNTFNKGKNNIEKAIKAEPDNVEIRFVRLSVQKNLPSFLGYKQHIEEDEKFIRTNSKNIRSVTLKKMIAETI